MRILYAVAGEGFGHAVRSRVVIKHLLSRGHSVKIICGGTAFDYLKNYFDNVVKIQAWNTGYHKNKISGINTVFLSIKKLPKHIKSIRKISGIIKNFKPKVLITDFEANSCYAALIKKLPVIVIDNNNLVGRSKFSFPRKQILSFLKIFFVVHFLNPRIHFALMPSFFSARPRKNNFLITAPVLREEILKLRAQKKGHFLVYQNHNSDEKLFKFLKFFKDKFIIYGFNKNAADKNIVFRKFNENVFFKELASCRGVICNGSMNIICEAIYLDKPLLCLPIKGHFEQLLNSFQVQKSGFGLYSEKVNFNKIKNFINNLEIFKAELRRNKWTPNKELFEKLDFLLRKFQTNEKE